MSNDLKQQVIDAITSGAIQPTTIVMGDQVQNKINVESGGHIQIINGQPQNGNSATEEKDYCEYINRDNLQEQGLYTLDEFERMMSAAAKEPAPQFAKFLKRYLEQGNLDFHGHNKKQIFDNLREHFTEMRDYDYSNFAAAY